MKINFKLFPITTLVLTGVFSLFFLNTSDKILAQNPEEEIRMYTTGYSVLSASSFVFGGYYSGNFDKKGFTTYFEFKKNDSDLNDPTDREKTIIIKRFPNADEYGYFYTSPELNLFSDYYFRAVGCFEENSAKDDDCSKHDSTKKFYGETFHLRTGYIPYGANPPFTINKDYEVLDYNVPSDCDFTDDLLKKTCETETAPACASSKELKDGNCVDKNKTSTTTTSSSTTPPDTSKSKSSSPDSASDSADTDNDGLVPCGKSDEKGIIDNPCGFDDIMKLINKVIDFVFLNLILPLSAIMFAYAGFELVTSGGETSKREKAKKIFTNVAIGLIVAVAAFLIIKTILAIVGYTGTSFLE